MNERLLPGTDSRSPRRAGSAGVGECRFVQMSGSGHRRLRSAAAACLAGIVLLLAGCRQPVEHVQVSGAVLVDGVPASGVQVLFHPQNVDGGSVASGITDQNGLFTLQSGLEPGVLPGSYRVVAIWPDASVKPTEVEVMMGLAEPGPDLLGGRYSSLRSSTLTAEIGPETMMIPPFELSTSEEAGQ